MNPSLLIVDLFCGAGGTTTGFAMADNGIARVIACVNHDPKAIESHWKNHPEVKHFEEDIQTLDLTELGMCVKDAQDNYPDAKLVLWASLECTNFSKAKGGQPRDADSRTLADHLHRYVEMIRPDYVMIENVVEFMSWGEMDDNGKPVSSKNGCDWLRWKREMCDHGYYDDWKELNSADFGALTSRNRLFGIFARFDLPIAWPEPTHTRKASGGTLFPDLKPWNPAKNAIDFSDNGKSIIHRKRKLAKRTIAGIVKGFKKYIVNGESSFLYHYYGNSCQTSINKPCSTFRTKQSAFLVQAFIHNPSWGRMQVHSINEPAPVLIARWDKAPLRVVFAEEGSFYKSDTVDLPEHYTELIELMVKYNVSDIFYRPIRVKEALCIQGFPENYVLIGSQEDNHLHIGNSVVPLVVKVWTEALVQRINDNQSEKVA